MCITIKIIGISDETTQCGLGHDSRRLEVITSPNNSPKKSASLQNKKDNTSDVQSDTTPKYQKTKKKRQRQTRQKSNKSKAENKTFINNQDSCQAEIAILKGIFPLTEENCTPPLTDMGICSQHLVQDWCPTNHPTCRLYKNVTTNLGMLIMLH